MAQPTYMRAKNGRWFEKSAAGAARFLSNAEVDALGLGRKGGASVDVKGKKKRGKRKPKKQTTPRKRSKYLGDFL